MSPRTAKSGGDPAREWVRRMADQAHHKAQSQPRVARRLNREKELFAQRAQHVKSLFQRLEGLCDAVNKQGGGNLLSAHHQLNSKNLGGIEVPDGARLVLKFLDRRIEVVINPLQSVGGRPAPIGDVASASVMLYDASDPTGADWYDVVLREDGWHRKTADGDTGSAALGESDLKRLIEWLLL
ncbi:MAG: hypothetical protein FJ144_25080 [Deltaproteobacteria bacterium]|nr:hypothetical protein [Deltaproteobacteria bacterium]